MKINFTVTSLFIFITLCIMNIISWNNIINTIGLYGKIFWVALSIIILLIQSFKSEFMRITNSIKIFILPAIFIIFSINFYFNFNESLFDSLFSSTIFFIYIIYFYLLINSFKQKYQTNIKISILNDISLIFQKSIIINVLIWTVIGNIILGVGWYDIDPTGERSGLAAFTQDRMAFSLLISTLFINTFIRYQLFEKNYFNLLVLFISIFLILLSDSRTSQSIIFIFIFIYYLKNNLKNIEFLTIILFTTIFYLILLADFNLNINFVDISSGRVYIWGIVLQNLKNDYFTFGYGLFNFNDIILNQYKSFNYYFQRIDFLYFHSSYIQIISAGGIFSLLIYAYTLVKTYIKSDLITKSSFLAISVGALFESYILSPIIPISSLFWLLIIIENIKEKKHV